MNSSSSLSSPFLFVVVVCNIISISIIIMSHVSHTCLISSVWTQQQAYQLIFMTGQKYLPGFSRLTGFSYRSQRGAQTKAAVVFESANHLIITLTSQVWPTIPRPGSQSPALFARLFYLHPCACRSSGLYRSEL